MWHPMYLQWYSRNSLLSILEQCNRNDHFHHQIVKYEMEAQEILRTVNLCENRTDIGRDIKESRVNISAFTFSLSVCPKGTIFMPYIAKYMYLIQRPIN